MTTTAELTLQAFGDALAAQTSTPGGGGAAAVAGSLAAALVSMVINFTIGKKKYAHVEEEFHSYLAESEQLRAELLALADRDVEAFTAVAATYAMPKESEADRAARSAALQEALKGAALVPFTVAEKCLEVIRLVELVGAKGNANVVSDAATAIYLAQAGLMSAIVNVNINLKSIKDANFVLDWSVRRDDLLARAATSVDAAKRACAATLGVTL